MSKTPNVTELVRKLRVSIADLACQTEPEFLDSNETLIRFLKSREWDVVAAEKMLRRTVTWRGENRPQSMECEHCRANPGIHTLRQIGFDEAQRPVIYASFYPAHESQKNSTQGVLPHLIYVIENAIRSMSPRVSQWVFVIDCAGMTAKGCHPRLGYECAQVMSNHYPERLGLALCIRPGPVFKAAWQAMKPFLPPATARKVHIVSNQSQLKPTLDTYFTASMTEWIIQEYESNRRHPTIKRFRPFWCPAQANGNAGVPHDPRGERRYVEKWVQVQHPSGHRPHPNMIDYNDGRLQEVCSVVPPSGATSEPTDYGEDEDDMAVVDEATAKQLLDSLPKEFLIPPDAEKLE